MTTARATPDWGYRSIATLLWVVAVWLLALPFSGVVQVAALNRYHLQTRPFPLWAIQAPVPAMYNFRNTFTLGPQPWDIRPVGRPVTGTLNHFPTRLYTFGADRGGMLAEFDRHTLTVTSSYRGRSLTTRWRIGRNVSGALELTDEVVP